MKALEVLKTIVDESSCKLIKAQRGNPEEYDVQIYEGKKRGWVLVDLYSASVALSVYNCLSDTNKEKFEKMSILGMVDISFKCCGKVKT